MFGIFPLLCEASRGNQQAGRHSSTRSPHWAEHQAVRQSGAVSSFLFHLILSHGHMGREGGIILPQSCVSALWGWVVVVVLSIQTWSEILFLSFKDAVLTSVEVIWWDWWPSVWVYLFIHDKYPRRIKEGEIKKTFNFLNEISGACDLCETNRSLQRNPPPCWATWIILAPL